MRIFFSAIIIGGILMAFQLIGAGSDLASTQTQMNKNILELKNNETTTVFKDDTGTRRVLLGKGADGFYGVKVSQEGIDVYSAADNELVFNSSQNVFKIAETSTLTVDASTAGGAHTGTVEHNLGYNPAVMVFVKLPNDTIYFPVNYYVFDGAGASYIRVSSWTNTTEIKFQVGLSASVTGTYLGEYVFKYYLLQETAN